MAFFCGLSLGLKGIFRMNIIKLVGAQFRKPLSVTLFMGTALLSVGLSVGQAYAGFQVADPSVNPAPSQQVQQVQNVQMDGTPIPASEKPKALEIFNDRYVPDTVRKKYKLDDSWFEKGQPADAAPVSLTPNVLEINEAAPKNGDAPVTRYARLPTEIALATKTPVESWRGRKGENIHDVLQRWSERGGANLMWASPDAPTLQKEFTFVGKFQDAVNALIKAEGGDKIHSQYRSEGLDPVMMTPASTVTTNATPVPQDDVADANAAEAETTVNPLAKIFTPEEPKKDMKPETRWFALSGASLAEVVQVWADDAGVRLIWQAEKNFAVKESISQVGHFEDAVFRAFNQYDGEQVRPVGEMYQDPQNGQKVLLVRTEVN